MYNPNAAANNIDDNPISSKKLGELLGEFVNNK